MKYCSHINTACAVEVDEEALTISTKLSTGHLWHGSMLKCWITHLKVLDCYSLNAALLGKE